MFYYTVIYNYLNSIFRCLHYWLEFFNTKTYQFFNLNFEVSIFGNSIRVSYILYFFMSENVPVILVVNRLFGSYFFPPEIFKGFPVITVVLSNVGEKSKLA